jgi:hypothetical protein
MPTYDLLKTATLESSSNLVDFTSIPNTYTDLVLALNIKSTFGSGSSSEYRLRFNGDGGNNYSSATLRANSAPSLTAGLKAGTEGWATIVWSGDADNNWGAGGYIHIMRYKDTGKYKLWNAHTGNAFGVMGNGIVNGLWNDTTTINRIEIFPQRDSFAVGSTFDLYGILGA